MGQEKKDSTFLLLLAAFVLIGIWFWSSSKPANMVPSVVPAVEPEDHQPEPAKPRCPLRPNQPNCPGPRCPGNPYREIPGKQCVKDHVQSNIDKSQESGQGKTDR